MLLDTRDVAAYMQTKCAYLSIRNSYNTARASRSQ